MKLLLILAAGAAAMLPLGARAQTLDEPAQRQLVGRLDQVLKDNYVFPDRLPAILPRLDTQISPQPVDAKILAERLTTALIAATNDLHFAVAVDPAAVAAGRDAKARGQESSEADQKRERDANFGFRRAEMLDGGIAYIRSDFFADPQYGAETAAGVMRFTAPAEALILDMRYNNGGTLEMAQYLMSTLFPAGKEQMFFDYFYNKDGVRVARGQWNLATVPGLRRPTMPVVVLTSSTTFSAAEWIAFSLQKLGRATIIGERTSGAAHPVARLPIDDRFLVQLPIGQISDPVSGKDFEGVGVHPDIDVASPDALLTARSFLLEAMAKDGDAAAAWVLPVVRAELSGYAPGRKDLESLVGAYQGRFIEWRGKHLTYRWRERFTRALTPISDTLFAVEGTDDYRFRFVRAGRRVVAIEMVSQDGAVKRYDRLD